VPSEGRLKIDRPKRFLVGKLLGELRRECNLTQRQAADRLGVGQSYIAQIERGYIRLDVPMLEKILEIYEADLVSFARLWVRVGRTAPGSAEGGKQA
jgi:transcriptional regulator with XRE-family HTH domain